MLVLLLLAVASSPAPAAGDGEAMPVTSSISSFCSPNGTSIQRKYQPNSTFDANLRSLVATLPANASATGFSAGSFVGAGPAGGAAAYGIVLCRGDFLGDQCVACLQAGFRQAASTCLYSTDATMYYDQCQLRYSDQDFLAGGGASNMPETTAWNMNKVSDGDAAAFDALVVRLVDAVSDAASNRSGRYATGQAGFPRESPNVYALAQCTPDLPPGDCRRCLADLIAQMPRWFKGLVGGRILGVRCDIRYEKDLFFATSQSTLTLTSLAGSTKGSNTTLWVVAIVVPVSVLLACFLACFLWIRKRRRRARRRHRQLLRRPQARPGRIRPSLQGRAPRRPGGRHQAAVVGVRAGAGGVQDGDPADRQAAAHQPGPSRRLLRAGGREDARLRVHAQQEPRLLHLRRRQGQGAHMGPPLPHRRRRRAGAALPAQALAPQGHPPRPQGQQHPAGQGPQPQDLRLWDGQDLLLPRHRGKHHKGRRHAWLHRSRVRFRGPLLHQIRRLQLRRLAPRDHKRQEDGQVLPVRQVLQPHRICVPDVEGREMARAGGPGDGRRPAGGRGDQVPAGGAALRAGQRRRPPQHVRGGGHAEQRGGHHAGAPPAGLLQRPDQQPHRVVRLIRRLLLQDQQHHPHGSRGGQVARITSHVML